MENNIQEIVNSNYNELSNEQKKSVFFYLGKKYGYENGFDCEINFLDTIQYNGSTFNTEKEAYIVNIPTTCVDFENITELYLVLKEFYHEMAHAKQRSDCNKGIETEENIIFAKEFALLKTNYADVYYPNHDNFAIEINANLNACINSWNFIRDNISHDKIDGTGVYERVMSDYNYQTSLLEKQTVKYEDQVFTGSYQENFEKLFAICESKSPLLSDLIELELEHFNKTKAM